MHIVMKQKQQELDLAETINAYEVNEILLIICLFLTLKNCFL